MPLVGCVTEPGPTPREQLFGTVHLRDDAGLAAAPPGGSVVDPDANVRTTMSRLRTEIAPLGLIDYNLRTMPLVSPDGRWIASETGIEPDLATVTATLDASIPSATSVTVYEIVRSAENGAPTIERRTVLEGGTLLGRSCNESGFVIESPRPDGSRWLGFVDWETTEITWFARDEFVNAFGVIGPPGHLAWSRRLSDSPHFELVVVRGGEMTVYGEELVSLLYPTFSSRGDGVFVLRLDREGNLAAEYLRGRSRAEMQQSRREIILSKSGSAAMTYTMMAAYPAVADLRAAAQPTFLFDHPEFRGVGVWRPLQLGPGAATMLEFGSTAGVIDEREFIVYTRRDELLAQPLTAPESRTVVARGVFLPRITATAPWRYVLFSPLLQEPGRMQVTGLSLLSGN